MATAKKKGLNYTYRLRITLMSGLGYRYKGIYRDIDIGADNTLARFHRIIVSLFDREDDHLWKFMFGQRSPWSRGGLHIGGGHSFSSDDMYTDYELDSREVTLGQLNLCEKMVFFYWFDFGDDWMHRIRVMRVDETADTSAGWWLVKSVGDSPEQYPGFDDEDEDEEDDE